MIFAAQRWLEDYFQRRGFTDPDQFAVRLANAYDAIPQPATRDAKLRCVARVRTAFFRANGIRERREFEGALVDGLERSLQKKAQAARGGFPGGVAPEARRLHRLPRRTIRSILSEFRQAIEARAVDTMWLSRRRNSLRQHPESVAQGLLEMFLKGVVRVGGFSLREVGSGIGYMDIIVVFSSVLHIVELKVLTSGFTGLSQLATYMKQESRREGWLVVFDARRVASRTPVPERINLTEGAVHVINVDVNPTPPSKKN